MKFNFNFFLIAFYTLCFCKSSCGLTISSVIYQINEYTVIKSQNSVIYTLVPLTVIIINCY